MNPQTVTAPTADPALAPIVLEVAVPCPPERAFEYFARDIASWWPLATHSCGERDAVDVRFEPRAGGGLVETTRDGTTHRWGTVSAWEPGARLAFSWHPGRDERTAQWIELTFTPTPRGTRVALTHGGFEALGERGAGVRTNYVGGWKMVLGERYAGYCAERVNGGPG